MFGELDRSRIFITGSPQSVVEELLRHIHTTNYRLFDKEEFLIDDAHELISHAYIASETTKYLIVKALSINNVSQNAMLKLLEEPPSNVVILFIAPSKAIFLPTIRSRIPVTMLPGEKETVEVDFDFDRLTLGSVFEFIKTNRFLGKKEAKAFIEKAFEHYQRFPLSSQERLEEELEEFDRSFRLLELNSPSVNVLSTILLMLLEKQRAVPSGR